MLDVMIDIETLDIVPTAAILSVGMVVFEAETYEIYAKKMWRVTDGIKSGGSINPETINWWMHQDQAAREASFPDKSGNYVDGQMGYRLSQVLYDISDQINYHKRTNQFRYIWARGPQFDITILEESYRRLNKQIPWRYDDVRDQRTIVSLVDSAFTKITRAGTAHNPLDDCLNQITQLKITLNLISGKPNTVAQ